MKDVITIQQSIYRHNAKMFKQIFKKEENMTDLANRDTDFEDFDQKTERANKQQEAIDSGVADMWKDKEAVVKIIVENSEDINNAAINYSVINDYDEFKAVEKIITDAMRIEVKQALGI